MVVYMADVFRKKFPVFEKDITSPSPEDAIAINESLIASLALAQEKYEMNLRPPSPEVMKRPIYNPHLMD